MTEVTRAEMDAKFEAGQAHFGSLDARMSAHEARTDAKYTELVTKIDGLADTIREFKTEVRQDSRDIRADNKNTRATIVITLIASMLAFAGAMWTAQANLLAAFQAGLTRQPIVSAAPPERKAALADAR